MCSRLVLLLFFTMCVVSSHAKTLKIFILTGQSNSLGTLGKSDLEMKSPAPFEHAACKKGGVPFFWDNRADGSDKGDRALGDSGNAWVELGPQQGGYYGNNDDHWGPEIGFSRKLWDEGYRDFAVVKASRGGGGNSFWLKGAKDDHMYRHLLKTVLAAVKKLPAGYTDYEICALLYVQGESNNQQEADEADKRFIQLMDDLKKNLKNAAELKAVIGAIGGNAASARALTSKKHQALAKKYKTIGYASNKGMKQHDGLHYTADAQILLGERMAEEMISMGSF